MKYYSQFQEDMWLDENAPLPSRGFFIDVGAADPEYFSNTRFFEDKGWTGICVDANPYHYNNLVLDRKKAFYCAVRDFDGITPFYITDNPDYSRTTKRVGKGKTIQVPCFKLATILKMFEVNKIDLLSIDTEGTEVEVLQSFDINKYAPKAIIVEFNSVGLASTLPKIIRYFKDKPYKKVHQTESNVIFYRQ